jgi:hypothetical protein
MFVAFQRNEVETFGFYHSKELMKECKARQIIHTYTLLSETANVHQMIYKIHLNVIEYILENTRDVKIQKNSSEEENKRKRLRKIL